MACSGLFFGSGRLKGGLTVAKRRRVSGQVMLIRVVFFGWEGRFLHVPKIDHVSFVLGHLNYLFVVEYLGRQAVVLLVPLHSIRGGLHIYSS